MFRFAIFALLVFGQTAAASAAAGCAGADPAITSVAVKGMSSDGSINSYDLSGTVVNLGSVGQASDVLQFVNIYKGGVKLDSRGIPPLKPGESYTFSYASSRSKDAGNGSTVLRFAMDGGAQATPGSQDCDRANGQYMLSF
jgi:hypothetical protein